MEFGVWGLGAGVWGLGSGAWGVGSGLGLEIWGLGFGVWGFRGSSLIRPPNPPKDPTVALCLGTYGDPRGVGVSYGRSTLANPECAAGCSAAWPSTYRTVIE